jgi:alpha-D-xyloside xylohydrolase
MILNHRRLFGKSRPLVLVLSSILFFHTSAFAQMIGEPVDVSQDFAKLEQVFFIGNRVTMYDAGSGMGALEWARHLRQPGLSFNKLDLGFSPAKSSDFPGAGYDENPSLPFSISFLSPRTVRLRLTTRSQPLADSPSLMLVPDLPRDKSWKVEQNEGAITYTSTHGSVRVVKDPWQIELLDKTGRLLTRTQNLREIRSFAQPVPFSFVRRGSDLGRSIAASFRLSHDEKIFGCGESFTGLNKRGQKVVAYTRDAMGAQTSRMYKPIPFFMSSNGYGMFVHTSAPVTFDFGHSFDQSNIIYTGDEILDLFIFLGDPKEILSEYTAVTGRSPMLPLWSFGLWMSRITYKSEDEVRDVAAKLRQHRIPSDVIHIDTGWFETEWQCNYKFSPTRFRNPAGMISDLRKQGFRISLWQLPYFTSKNEMFQKAVSAGYVVRNEGGMLPAEDAILDFSNPEAVKWYQGLLADLLKLGVGAIKVDFGEDAPLRGVYASGRTGYYEHNLYPLRYNKAVADITKTVTGDSIIWARSAWAGSQRYPLHWGGDAENSNSAMAATLRAGLSFGLSGFTFWSHDVAGFVQAPPRDLYRRWLPFGVLTSHTRCHGVPPREPWAFDEAFIEDFRLALELKYSLMPYIYAQAKDSAGRGLPMLRALFLEYPDDPTSWLVDDEYLLGSDLLVAPLMEEGNSRKVYLPPGAWVDYQSGKVYRGAQWHTLTAGRIPIILLVRDHSAIPLARVAQSTAEIDWKQIELRVFSTDQAVASALFALPEGNLQRLTLDGTQQGFALREDPLRGQVKWQINRFETR